MPFFFNFEVAKLLPNFFINEVYDKNLSVSDKNNIRWYSYKQKDDSISEDFIHESKKQWSSNANFYYNIIKNNYFLKQYRNNSWYFKFSRKNLNGVKYCKNCLKSSNGTVSTCPYCENDDTICINIFVSFL